MMSDIEHGGVTDEALEKWLQDNPITSGPYASDPHPPTDPEPEPNPQPAVEPSDPTTPPTDPTSDPQPAPATEPGAEPDPSTPAETTPAPSEGESGGEGESVPSSPITDDPQTSPLTETELAQLAAIRDAIQSDDGLRQRIVEYYQGGSQGGVAAPSITPSPTPSAPILDPSTLDLTDPSVAALYGALVEQQQHLEHLRTQQTQLANQSYEAIRTQTNALYQRAAETFQSAHSLSDDDLNKVATIAARLNVLPSLMSGVDPITGLPSAPDPLSAMSRALDIAYNALPEMAAKAAAAAEQTQRRHNTRKQKLAAVAGSSGSVPRTTAPPRDPKQAMIQEVAAMMTGDWSESQN